VCVDRCRRGDGGVPMRRTPNGGFCCATLQTDPDRLGGLMGIARDIQRGG